RIMDTGDGGLGQNTVKFQPIGRLNAILVIARKPEQLRAASTWIARLDKSDASNTAVRVYRVRYGEARQLAKILNDLFVGSVAGGLDTPTNQIAPGGGINMISSGPAVAGSGSASSSGGSPTVLNSPTAGANLPGLAIAGARVQPGAQSIDSRSAADAAAASSSVR